MPNAKDPPKPQRRPWLVATLTEMLPLVVTLSALLMSALLLWHGATELSLLALMMAGAFIWVEMRRRKQLDGVRALLLQMRQFAPEGSSPVAPGAIPDELAPLADALSRLSSRATEGWAEVTRNLDEQRHLREELQAMARQLMTVQEDERRILSHELHDDVGQSITAIKLCALALSHDEPEMQAATVTEIVAIADQTMAKVRNLSLLLRPPQLDLLGLEAAISGQADLLARSSRVVINLQIKPLSVRPSPAVELACFRIAQEAMTNALRHAGTPQVTICLEAQAEDLLLEVRDDGLGFIAGGKSSGLGLIIMRERAQQVGGTLEIESMPSVGSCIRASLPLSPAAT